ncbi:MAG: hypothetical protein ACR2QH_11665, partial [Geminicoccaceae bacterium]
RTPPRHKVRSQFLVLMYFAHLLPPEKVAAVAEDMISQWNSTLSVIDACLSEGGDNLSPSMKFVAGYGKAVIGAARSYVDQNRAGFIDDIRKEAVSSEAAD